MSFKERVSEGEDFIVERVPREFGSQPSEAFKIDGRTGVVSVAGQPITGGGGTGGFKYLLRVIAGRGDAGAVTCNGALVGDVVQNVILDLDTNVPPVQDAVNFGTAAGSFEDVVSVDGQVQQIADVDLSAFSYTIFLERAL